MTSPEDLPGAPGRDAVTGAPGAVSESGNPQLPTTGPAVRPARPEDVPEILAMVRELAEYERSAHEVRATEEMIADLLFGAQHPQRRPGRLLPRGPGTGRPS